MSKLLQFPTPPKCSFPFIFLAQSFLHTHLSSALIITEFSYTPLWGFQLIQGAQCIFQTPTCNCFSFLYFAVNLHLSPHLWSWQWLEGKWHEAKFLDTLTACLMCLCGTKVFWKCWLLYSVNRIVAVTLFEFAFLISWIHKCTLTII